MTGRTKCNTNFLPPYILFHTHKSTAFLGGRRCFFQFSICLEMHLRNSGCYLLKPIFVHYHYHCHTRSSFLCGYCKTCLATNAYLQWWKKVCVPKYKQAFELWYLNAIITSYASATSLNLASASSRLSTFLSGCHCSASFLYARLISAIDEVLETPRTLYQSFRLLNFRECSALINTSLIFISCKIQSASAWRFQRSYRSIVPSSVLENQCETFLQRGICITTNIQEEFENLTRAILKGRRQNVFNKTIV